MTALRVTAGSTQANNIARVQAAAQRLAQLQDQISSNKKISKASDDPVGATTALNLQSQLSRNNQYTANANDALSFMSTADGAYKSIVSQLQTAQTLTLQGMNSGASSTGSNAALADQIDALAKGIISVANTSYNGQAVFAGTSTSPTAYDSSGNYLGDSGAINRTVGVGNSVQVNQTGTQVFGAAGSSVFDTLTAISAALRAPSSPATSAALSTQLANLGTGLNRVSAAQALEGASYNQVQAAQTVADTANTQLTTQISNTTDIDFAQAVIDVTSANTAYQAALQTTATISQRSLLDFLQ